MTDLTLAELNEEWPLDWLHSSLSQGKVIAQKVNTALDTLNGRVRVLVPTRGLSVTIDPREGGWVRSDQANVALASVLSETHSFQSAYLYVEDDLRRPGDPALYRTGLKWFSIGSAIIHWCDVAVEPPLEVVRCIRRSSSGYPLNAFVASVAPPGDRIQSDDDFAEKIVSSLLAVIVSVFDAESFVIWTETPSTTLKPELALPDKAVRNGDDTV